jgi:vanillin dehydrogenase
MLAVLADVKPEMAAFRDELFGPVAAVIKANDAERALTLGNTSLYGLSSAVLTDDMQLAMRFAMELEAGMVHLNGPTVLDEVVAPLAE